MVRRGETRRCQRRRARDTFGVQPVAKDGREIARGAEMTLRRGAGPGAGWALTGAGSSAPERRRAERWQRSDHREQRAVSGGLLRGGLMVQPPAL